MSNDGHDSQKANRFLDLLGTGRCCVLPYRNKTQDNREPDIGAGVEPFAIVHQVQRLQAERRESGVPAANSDHHKLARRRADEHAPVYP
jgi:hypothetical protein